MKKFNALIFAAAISLTCTSFVGAADNKFEKLKINIISEEFMINMPSSVVAEKLIKIRTEDGVKLHFGGIGIKTNDDNWIISMSHVFGGYRLNFDYHTILTITDGSLVGIKLYVTAPSWSSLYFMGVEDDLKDSLVEGTVKFGKPLYQKIEEKSGSILWIHEGCRFEIEKSITRESKNTNITIELVDKDLIKKFPGDAILKLAKSISDKNKNITKSNKYNASMAEAMRKKEYDNALKACDKSIFYNPKPETFIERAYVHFSLNNFKKAKSDASQAFYLLLKQEGSGKLITEAFELNAQAELRRETHRNFEISSIRDTADFVISKYNPQTPKVYVIRALCLGMLKDMGDDIKDEDICSDLKKGCELGWCRPYHESQKDGKCK